MGELFLSVLNMSLTASYVIIFVIFIRLLLKKFPKVISYAMWGVVAFRLIIPFSFESIFSLMPRNTNVVQIPQDIIYQQNPQINSGIKVVDSFFSKSLPEATANSSINPIQIYIAIASYIWIIGIIVLLTYSIVSILILKRNLKSAELVEKNIFKLKNLKTPFVLGLIRPKIYLPDGLNIEERRYILLHEQTHIKRKDHIIKVLAFLILSIHWFNPLVWIAFMLMSEDMELSCDEKVLKEINEDIKKPYANSLLSLATGKHILNGSPLAFGEGNIKSRIKNVLNYKKSGLWIIVITVVLALAVSIGLLANPINTIKISDIDTVPLGALDEAVYGTLTSENKHMNFNEAKAEEIADYLREIKVNKSEVARTVSSDRDKINQVHFVIESISSGKSYKWDIYCNFSKDFSKVWLDNGVKPSFSYEVKNPSEVKAFFERQFGSVANVMEVAYFDELWKARTKYVGDNSAVGNLIGLLPIAEDIKYDHFELNTSEQDYDIEIVYSTSSDILKEYDTEETIKSDIFRKNALILLALVDNSKGVRATLTDGKREVGFINGREWADYAVGEDVRNYAKSPQKLQELIENSFDSMNGEEEALDFTSYPEDYSLEQGVKDGFFVVVHGEIKGDSRILLDKFLKSVEKKEPSYLKILQYTIEGDPVFVALLYNGGNAPITANFDSTRDKFGVQTETTSMQAKYIKTFEQDDIVGIYLTDKEDIRLEDVLNSSSECINIVNFNK
ncbi:M56 family metallopeptidase [Clostridium sp.]|uniref:M56 family metallopeptidase n=1 Tax=Clostridium sp. TaxID=1506 RepID=UPI0026257FA4|nr:M56 family metallopeptidase [Clostridium sp.]